jgi:hypothetical protein
MRQIANHGKKTLGFAICILSPTGTDLSTSNLNYTEKNEKIILIKIITLLHRQEILLPSNGSFFMLLMLLQITFVERKKEKDEGNTFVDRLAAKLL